MANARIAKKIAKKEASKVAKKEAVKTATKKIKKETAEDITRKIAQKRLNNKEFKVPYASDAKPSIVDEMINKVKKEAEAVKPMTVDNKNFISKKIDNIRQKKIDKIKNLEDARLNGLKEIKEGTSEVLKGNNNKTISNVFEDTMDMHYDIKNRVGDYNFEPKKQAPESVFNSKNKSSSNIKEKIKETKENPTKNASTNNKKTAEEKIINNEKIDSFAKKAMPIAVGGGIVFGLWNTRGHQSNAQLYGQAPMQGQGGGY